MTQRSRCGWAGALSSDLGHGGRCGGGRSAQARCGVARSDAAAARHGITSQVRARRRHAAIASAMRGRTVRRRAGCASVEVSPRT
ncbi:hypothetical protein BSIN_1085 [Burkholderia singularis]|uniref:Uncharacterized protein n=1 Tax=Burkholderia singularis TaxID=1503053 RepID=A0A238HC89_9BURK|nr:hypothetical protein BSIN_1085 [Burkholderia singularis]